MTTVYVKAIPQDLAIFILQKQVEFKTSKGLGKYSQSQTIVHLLRQLKQNEDKRK